MLKLEGKDKDYFLKCCEDAGIKVTEGSGRVTMNGQPINVKEVLDKAFLSYLNKAALREDGDAE